MKNNIKIDIVSDVVCPWCIIGYKHLMQAIEELNLEKSIEIQWQPFELNPNMPPEGEHLREHSARKYGSTPQSSAQFRIDMTNKGKDVNFDFNFFEEMKIVNTRDAHILLEYAKEECKQTALKLRLFAAFFSEQKDISQRDILINEAQAVGLNPQKVTQRLETTSASVDIQQAEEFWQRAGVSSVPTVVFNRTHALVGAQPVEAFKQALLAELEAK